MFSHIDELYAKNEDDLYQGEYTKEIAVLIKKNNMGLPIIPKTSDQLLDIPEDTRNFIVKNMVDRIKTQLNNLNIKFDNWFYETSLFDLSLIHI